MLQGLGLGMVQRWLGMWVLRLGWVLELKLGFELVHTRRPIVGKRLWGEAGASFTGQKVLAGVCVCVSPCSWSDICSCLTGRSATYLTSKPVSNKSQVLISSLSERSPKRVQINLSTCLLFSSSCSCRNSSSISLNRPTSSQFCRNRVGVGV